MERLESMESTKTITCKNCKIAKRKRTFKTGLTVCNKCIYLGKSFISQVNSSGKSISNDGNANFNKVKTMIALN